MDIRKRLETDLKEVVGRLRQMGGSAALEELLGPGEHWAYADEVDEIGVGDFPAALGLVDDIVKIVLERDAGHEG